MVRVNLSSSNRSSLQIPLGCGIQTGAGTILNRLRPEFGSSVVVCGAGAVGLSAVMAEGKSIIGVIEGDSIPRVFIPQLVACYKAGQFPFDRLIKFYEFEQINQAFDDSASGTTIKPVLKMNL